MTEETIDVLFPEFAGPPMTAKDVAKALAKGGVPHSAASARVASYAKNRLVHVRGRKSDAVNSPNVFGISDIAAAKVLSGLHDMGIADLEVLHRASDALYFWNGTPPEGRKGDPITNALVGTLRGEDWVFRMEFWRNPQTEERRIHAWLSNDNVPQRFEGCTPDWVPMAAITMLLEPHLLPLSYLFGVPKGAN